MVTEIVLYSKNDIKSLGSKLKLGSTQNLLSNKVEELRDKYRQMRNDPNFRKAKTPKNIDPDI